MPADSMQKQACQSTVDDEIYRKGSSSWRSEWTTRVIVCTVRLGTKAYSLVWVTGAQAFGNINPSHLKPRQAVNRGFSQLEKSKSQVSNSVRVSSPRLFVDLVPVCYITHGDVLYVERTQGSQLLPQASVSKL